MLWFRSAEKSVRKTKIALTGIFVGFSAAARPSSLLEEHGEVAGDELVAVGPRPGGRVVALARHVALQEDVVVHLFGWVVFQSRWFPFTAQG